MLRTFLIATLLVWAGVADAQTIRGSVVDEGSRPVPGVLVVMLDSASRQVARSLTDERGQFRVASDRGPGTYRIRTLRIGYRPALSEPIALLMGGEVERAIILSGARVILDTMRVVDRGSCRLDEKAGAATFAAWEQARAALMATQVTSTSRALNVTLVAYTRTLDRTGQNDLLDREATLQTGYLRQPWRSLSADSLHRAGFVSTDTYYGPSIDVLLSDVFLADHCVRLTTSSDSTLVGIAFTPNPERKLPEIEGVLWLNRASLEVRRLEFRYTNIPRVQADRAGGELEFARLRSGQWVISRWSIRMPVLEDARLEGASLSRGERVAQIQVQGGELALIRQGNDTVWTTTPMTLAGEITDSTSAAGVPGAWLAVRGTGLVATADARGQFTLPGLLPGQYTLDAHTAALDSVGVFNTVNFAFVDSAARLRIRVQRPKVIGAMFTGRVLVDSEKTAIIGAEVSLPDVGKTAISDGEGRFRITGIPAGEHRVVVRRVGYGPLDTRLPFANNRTVDRSVYLSRAVTLDSVVVTDRRTEMALRDFEDNRRVGLGHFLTRAELTKMEGLTMAAVLAQMPGGLIARARVGGLSKAAIAQILSRGPPSGLDESDWNMPKVCYSTVWVDEVKVYYSKPVGLPPLPLFDLNTLSPSQIEGVEWYASAAQTPGKYNDLNSACGVLVIHTRRTP